VGATSPPRAPIRGCRRTSPPCTHLPRELMPLVLNAVRCVMSICLSRTTLNGRLWLRTRSNLPACAGRPRRVSTPPSAVPGRTARAGRPRSGVERLAGADPRLLKLAPATAESAARMGPPTDRRRDRSPARDRLVATVYGPSAADGASPRCWYTRRRSPARARRQDRGGSRSPAPAPRAGSRLDRHDVLTATSRSISRMRAAGTSPTDLNPWPCV
jgi:hypothetical protein